MAKRPNEKKPRPDKYAEKVKLNLTFDESLRKLAEQANKATQERLAHEKEDHDELVEA